jgi:hypothetical protein
MALRAHPRKLGPATAGRNTERDVKICAARWRGLSFDALGHEFGLSRERLLSASDWQRRGDGEVHCSLRPSQE